MTPKDKAKELVDKYFQTAENIKWTKDEEIKEKSAKFNDELGNDVLIYWNELAKQCTLIAVDECLHTCVESMIYYWKEVKNEIENL